MVSYTGGDKESIDEDSSHWERLVQALEDLLPAHIHKTTLWVESGKGLTAN